MNATITELPLENILPTLQPMDIDADSLDFDTALGFEPISPVLHPSAPDAWLQNIPDYEESHRERRALQQITEHSGFKVVEVKDLIDPEETILFHIKSAADWLVANGPAPKTLDEWWMRSNTPEKQVFLLIYYQRVFFGHDSLSPWQIDYLGDYWDEVMGHSHCMLCGMILAPWCYKVVIY